MNLTCKLRNRRRRERAKEIPVKKRKRVLRNRAVTTLEPEAAVLDQLLAGGRGGIVVIPSLNPAFEKARGQTICLVHALSGAGSPWLAQTGARYGASAGRCLATRNL